MSCFHAMVNILQSILVKDVVCFFALYLIIPSMLVLFNDKSKQANPTLIDCSFYESGVHILFLEWLNWPFPHCQLCIQLSPAHGGLLFLLLHQLPHLLFPCIYLLPLSAGQKSNKMQPSYSLYHLHSSWLLSLKIGISRSLLWARILLRNSIAAAAITEECNAHCSYSNNCWCCDGCGGGYGSGCNEGNSHGPCGNHKTADFFERSMASTFLVPAQQEDNHPLAGVPSATLHSLIGTHLILSQPTTNFSESISTCNYPNQEFDLNDDAELFWELH